MRRFGPYTLAVGVPLEESLPGASAALAYLVFYNFSIWTLQVNISGASPIIAPEFRDGLPIDPTWNWDGSLVITPEADIMETGASTTLWILGYGAGETLPENVSVSLSHTVTGAITGVQATTLSNEGLPVGTLVVDVGGNLTGDQAATTLYNDGAFHSLATVPTAGQIGVPVVVAETPSAGIHITTTAQTTILAYTPPAVPASGQIIPVVYRVSAIFSTNSGAQMSVVLNYTDLHTGAAQSTRMGGPPANSFNNLAVAASTSAPMFTTTIQVLQGNPITLLYTDSLNTPPNDHAWAMIEALF